MGSIENIDIIKGARHFEKSMPYPEQPQWIVGLLTRPIRPTSMVGPNFGLLQCFLAIICQTAPVAFMPNLAPFPQLPSNLLIKFYEPTNFLPQLIFYVSQQIIWFIKLN